MKLYFLLTLSIISTLAGLAIILLLWPGMFGLPAAFAGDLPALAPAQPADTFFQYLPLVQHSPSEPNPAIIEGVKTTQGEIEGYPTVYYAYGYVRNLTSEPLYNVVVSLDVTIFPYEDPLLEPDDIFLITPELTATLPGQLNPFSFVLLLGKASASIGPIVGVTASPWESGDAYAALTITGYAYEGSAVTGTARNDTDHPLHHARVGGYEPSLCSWREAELDTDELLPGQETGFSIPYSSSYCFDGVGYTVIGQGAYQP